MFTPFSLFFALTVAVAVIAYWSDNLGKKLGKKRVSLFGLRPRTTATIVTIGSSWGIMAATILVLLAVNKPLRDALFRFDRERAQNKILQDSSQELKAQNDELGNRNKDLGGKNKDLIAKNGELSQKNREAEKKLGVAQKNATDATKKAEQANKAKDRAEQGQQKAESARGRAERAERIARNGESAALNRARWAQASLSAAQARLDKTQNKLLDTNSRLKDADKKLVAASKSYNQAKSRLASVEKELDAEQKRVVVAQKRTQDAYKRTAEAFKRTAEAYKQVAEARQQLDDTRQQVQVLSAEREKLQEETNVLQVEYKKLYKDADAIRQVANSLGEWLNDATGDTVGIGVGQNLAERVVDTSTSGAQIEAGLRELVREGQIEVAIYKRDATLSLSTRLLRRGQDVVELPAEKVIPSLVDYLRTKNEKVSVRLVADRNFTVNEKAVTAHFVTVDVRPVLEAGEVLATGQIDGHLSDAKVFRELFDLVEEGQVNATKKGVNPAVSRRQPFYMEGTNERLFETLRQIREIGKPVQVKIVAAVPLNTVDPAQVRFEIESSGS